MSSGEKKDNEWLYYKINWEVFPEDTSNDQLILSSFFPKNGYVILEGDYKGMPNTEVTTDAGYGWGGRRQIYIRTPNILIPWKEENEYSVKWYKCNYKQYLNIIMESQGVHFLVEVTKEEYESFVQYRIEDMEYKELIIG